MLQAWRCFIIHSCRTPLLCFRGGWGHCWRERPTCDSQSGAVCMVQQGEGMASAERRGCFKILRSHVAELRREKRAALVPGSLPWSPCSRRHSGLQPQHALVRHLSRGTPAWFWQTHFHFCLESELEGLENWRMCAFPHSYYLLLISSNCPYDLPKSTSWSIHFIPSSLASAALNGINMGYSGSRAILAPD